MQQDNLVICPKCGSDGCYKTSLNESKFSYFDFGCGFQTNDLMIEGDFDIVAYEENLPELYKDLKYIDKEKRVWYPISINIEGQGTVFINGTSKDNWQWAAIKAIALTEEEKKEAKYKGKEFKSDAKSLKSFEKDFIEACSYLNLFNTTL